MKKGCFLTLITIITILIMAGVYLYKTNKDWLKEFGKEKLSGIIIDKLNEKIDKLHGNQFKDSVKALVKLEIKKNDKESFDNAMNNLGYISERIKFYSADGEIDSLEFAKLKLLVIENERSKKN